MGKKGKKAQAGKPKKLTPKDVGKRLDVLVKKLEEELEGADLFAPLPRTEDCAVCLVPLSRVNSETGYQACCGKDICWACYKENEGRQEGCLCLSVLSRTSSDQHGVFAPASSKVSAK